MAQALVQVVLDRDLAMRRFWGACTYARNAWASFSWDCLKNKGVPCRMTSIVPEEGCSWEKEEDTDPTYYSTRAGTMPYSSGCPAREGASCSESQASSDPEWSTDSDSVPNALPERAFPEQSCAASMHSIAEHAASQDESKSRAIASPAASSACGVRVGAEQSSTSQESQFFSNGLPVLYSSFSSNSAALAVEPSSSSVGSSATRVSSEEFIQILIAAQGSWQLSSLEQDSPGQSQLSVAFQRFEIAGASVVFADSQRLQIVPEGNRAKLADGFLESQRNILMWTRPGGVRTYRRVTSIAAAASYGTDTSSEPPCLQSA